MRTCSTCQHWTPSFDRWGSCEFRRELVHVESGELDTRADFGCVAHEPKIEAVTVSESLREYERHVAKIEDQRNFMMSHATDLLEYLLKRLGPPA